MILSTTIQSERGKEILKTSNEFIFFDLKVKKQRVGQIELYYFNDSVEDSQNCNEGEWLVKFKPAVSNNDDEQNEEDWDIIAQGNI